MSGGYRPFVRFWLAWSILVSGTDGWALAFTDLVASPAYGYARDIGPDWVWSMFSFGIVACFLTALVVKADLLIRIGLGLQAIMHAIFGLSILGLTLNGTSSAVVGASKWWGYVIIPLWLLSRPFRDEVTHGN